jgi:hypothetical protein
MTPTISYGHSPRREYGEKNLQCGRYSILSQLRSGTREFSDANVLRKFGDVPDDLSVL